MRVRLLALVSIGFFFYQCDSTVDPKPVDCNLSDLAISINSSQDASGCTTPDGSATVVASGGDEDYQYRIDGGTLQASASFDNLAPGIYQIDVMDGEGCERSVSVTIGSPSGVTITDLVAEDSGCGTSDGTITVTATGGSNLTYKLNDGSFDSNNVFMNLEAGTYTVTVKDDSGCEFAEEVTVKSGTPYATISSILSANCAVSGCHNGDNGSTRNWNVDQNVVNSAAAIKSRTGSGSMPPSSSGLSLTAEQIAEIACWVDDGASLN